MPSSSNTFGTFLNTFNSLARESQVTRAGKPDADVLINIVKDIASSGDEKPVRDLVRSLDYDRSRILSAIVEGKQQGLLELTEDKGESLARLTSLGRAFSG